MTKLGRKFLHMAIPIKCRLFEEGTTGMGGCIWAEHCWCLRKPRTWTGKLELTPAVLSEQTRVCLETVQKLERRFVLEWDFLPSWKVQAIPDLTAKRLQASWALKCYRWFTYLIRFLIFFALHAWLHFLRSSLDINDWSSVSFKVSFVSLRTFLLFDINYNMKRNSVSGSALFWDTFIFVVSRPKRFLLKESLVMTKRFSF